jgi:hypothetical protein
MRDMTWADFKALVEAAGVQETDTIDHFDFAFPTLLNDGRWSIEVFLDSETRTLTVT